MELETARLILRKFTEADYDDLYEFLSQLRDNEFEGYPGIDYENGREHLKYRVGSDEFYAKWKDTYVYAIIAACRAGKVKGADLLLR